MEVFVASTALVPVRIAKDLQLNECEGSCFCAARSAASIEIAKARSERKWKKLIRPIDGRRSGRERRKPVSLQVESNASDCCDQHCRCTRLILCIDRLRSRKQVAVL